MFHGQNCIFECESCGLYGGIETTCSNLFLSRYLELLTRDNDLVTQWNEIKKKRLLLFQSIGNSRERDINSWERLRVILMERVYNSRERIRYLEGTS